MAHALIFGASGISGWAVAKEALTYPTSTSFARVTGLTNRPLTIRDAYLPEDDRLHFVSGIDLTASVDEVVQGLKSKVDHIESVTHVFFAAYIDPGKGYEVLREVNVSILKTAIEAVTQVTTNLQTVILQTGGKVYGVEFPDVVEIKAPLKESYPRIPKPEADNIFYYPQYDTLAEMSENAAWTFTEVRPDVVVGFVPGTNAMNCAQGIGLYLSLYKAIYGEGAKVPFPGSHDGWMCQHSDAFQDLLAKFQLYTALNHTKCGNGQAFNIVNGDVVTWKDKWPGICAYFGLEGQGPGDYEPLDEFAKNNISVWNETVKKSGLKEGLLEKYGWGFLDFLMAQANFDRQYDLSAAREVGFDDVIDTVDSYKQAFDRMRTAKVIP